MQCNHRTYVTDITPEKENLNNALLLEQDFHLSILKICSE